MINQLLKFISSIFGKKKIVVSTTTTSTTSKTTRVKSYQATIYGGNTYVTYNTKDLALSIDSLPIKVYLNNPTLGEGTFIYKDANLKTQLAPSFPNFYSLELNNIHYAAQLVNYAGVVTYYTK